jgi:hypothetical protein
MTDPIQSTQPAQERDETENDQASTSATQIDPLRSIKFSFSKPLVAAIDPLRSDPLGINFEYIHLFIFKRRHYRFFLIQFIFF